MAGSARRQSEVMLFHPLGPEVKCPACGAGLIFTRVRVFGDLYTCTSGRACKCQVLHYRRKATRTCGTAAVFTAGEMEKWSECGQGGQQRKEQ